MVRVAKVIAGKIASIDGVVGIVATGGIGRGHSDKFSDLDLIVYVDEKKYREIDRYIAIGQLHYKGIDYDTPVESYQKALRRKSPSAYWSQAMRWTMENSRILYDTKGRIASLLKEKVVFPEKERRNLMRDNRHWADEILNYMYPTWEARGEVYHLAHILRQAAENVILWIYARHGKFQPYLRKWLFYYLENNMVPEAKYFNAVKKAFIEPIATRRQAEKIRAGLFKLCHQVGMDIVPITWHEVLETNSRNWDRASEKTKFYLSW
jgi:tetratricopeptide (TPR) repeat protein